MARRTPRQGQRGVQQATSRPVSTYTAPVYDSGAGSELFDLARGFAGLSQGLGQVIGAQQRNEAAEARAMEEYRDKRMKQTRDQFEAAQKQEEEVRKAQEAQRKQVNKDAAAMLDQFEVMREAGKSPEELTAFMMGHGSDPLIQEYNEWRQSQTEGDTDALSFLGSLRDPSVVTEVSELRGQYAADVVYNKHRETLMEGAIELFLNAAATGMSDADVMEELKFNDGLGGIQNELEASGLDPLQSSFAINYLRDKLTEDLQEARKIAEAQQREELTNGRKNKAYAAADMATSDDPVQRLKGLQQLRTTVERALQDPAGPTRDDAVYAVLDTWADNLEARHASGALDAFYLESAVRGARSMLRNNSTNQSILPPKANKRLADLERYYESLQDQNASVELTYEKAVDAISNSTPIRRKYRDTRLPGATRRANLEADANLVDRALASGGVISADDLEELQTLDPSLKNRNMYTIDDENESVMFTEAGRKELNHLGEALSREGKRLETERRVDRQIQKDAVDDAKPLLERELETNPSLKSYTARLEYLEALSDSLGPSEVTKLAADELIEEYAGMTVEMEKEVDAVIRQLGVIPSVKDTVKGAAMRRLRSSADWEKESVDAIVREFQTEAEKQAGATGKAKLPSPPEVPMPPIRYEVQVDPKTNARVLKGTAQLDDSPESDEGAGTLSIEELATVKIEGFDPKDAFNDYQTSKIVNNELFKWRMIMDELASTEYDWLDLLQMQAGLIPLPATPKPTTTESGDE